MKIVDTASLGKAICARRKELKYTQRFLSEVTGLSISFISDLERGKATTENSNHYRIISLVDR